MSDREILNAPEIVRTGTVMIGGAESRLVCLKFDGEVEAVAIDAGLVTYAGDEDKATVLLAAGKGVPAQVTGWHVMAHEGKPSACGRPWKGRLIPKGS